MRIFHDFIKSAFRSLIVLAFGMAPKEAEGVAGSVSDGVNVDDGGDVGFGGGRGGGGGAGDVEIGCGTFGVCGGNTFT